MTTKGLRRLIVSVADLDRALRFYRDVLDLPTAPAFPGFAVLTVPGGIDLMLHERPPTPGPAGVAASFTVDDVDAVTKAAAEVGCTVIDEPADQPWGERQSVLTDPDGHVVCLVSPSDR
ncbi:VOC family protein [Pseudonocardia sp. CA-107938]|uniref:VOC family protein n=1 Tax=Pseudonocardia sp. CA-107938 TaxID=3240021 RepID=UPI003D90E488